MFHSAKRTFNFLLHTPLLPPVTPPAAIELTTISAGPSRARALTGSNMRSLGGYTQTRGYASDKGKQELYGDEEGSTTGAGTDDVAHTDAAFNKDPNPQTSAKGVENESGKDYTTRSPANPAESQPPGKQGEKGSETPLATSKSEARK
ncbi:hypothetical protein IAT38_007678 [Cryptococcus sp. DSM 104549]